MSVKVMRGGGFFVVRSNGPQGISESWPEGATAGFADPRTVIVADAKHVDVRVGARADDALLDAVAQVERGRRSRIDVGRKVGRFGNANLYEQVAQVVADGTEHGQMFARKSYGADTKTVHAKITSVKGVEIEGWASTPEIDRDYDIVEPAAFAESITSFLKNPQLLYNHDFNRNAGLVTSVDFREKGMYVTARVMDPELADWVKSGRIRMFSVQFRIAPDGFKWEEHKIAAKDEQGGDIERTIQIRRITKGELYEISLVTVPACRTASFELSKALKGGTDEACDDCGEAADACACNDSGEVVEFRSTGIAPAGALGEDRLSKIVVALGRDAAKHALGRTGDEYRFQHHTMLDGELMLSREGLRMAMAACLGGVAAGTMAYAERRRLWKHLGRHYAELGWSIPELPARPSTDGFARVAFEGGELEPTELRMSKGQFAELADATAWAKSAGFEPIGTGDLGDAWSLTLVAGAPPVRLRPLDDGVSVVVRPRTAAAASAADEGSKMARKAAIPTEAAHDETPKPEPTPAPKPTATPPAQGGEPAAGDDDEPSVELSAIDAAVLETLADPDADSAFTDEQIAHALEAVEPHLDEE